VIIDKEDLKGSNGTNLTLLLSKSGTKGTELTHDRPSCKVQPYADLNECSLANAATFDLDPSPGTLSIVQ
jgi:hypothetical protein